MASTMRWLLSRDPGKAEAPTTGRGLPASWYRSPELYELERRAIFSKQWLLVTHKNRFAAVGDYIRFTEAGFSFFLCLDRQGKIGGFHNICRHRGFPLVQGDSGNAKIFACKYHGWSFGLDGKLAKAPHFQDFADFHHEENSLFPVHVHVDRLGFVWVNLEATLEPTVPWEELFAGVDTQKRLQAFNFDEYKLDHCWSLQGNYNWKTLSDNYNECYHCKTSHPDVASDVDLAIYRVEGRGGHVQHFNGKQEKHKTRITIASTYYFPNACMTVSPHFFYMMRCVPTSVNTCDMQYEVYRHKDALDADFDNINQIFKRILSEDKWLCNETQRNLQAGAYVNGQLHSAYEIGPLYLQGLVRERLMKHRKEEEKQKREIWPTMQITAGLDQTNDDIAFCSGLSCETQSKGALAW